jgi:arabinogalactan endo-1,4-beta-galactosidase
MNAILRLVCALVLGIPVVAAAGDGGFLRGVDLTGWDRYEVRGTVYRDATGDVVALPRLLADHGVDTVRLQVLRVPGFGGEERAARLAGQLRAQGLRIWLDLHFSERPAGPRVQEKPAAWRDLPFPQLPSALRRYVRDTVRTFGVMGGRPDFVQLGNEIGNGILWDDGRLGPGFDSAENRERFALLLKAAAEGVRDVLGDGAEIVIHLETAGDPDATRAILDDLVARGVRFDRIGLTYYPWYQGTLADLEATMKALAERYDRPVTIAETAYPWTLLEGDAVLNDVAQAAQLHPGFEATPEGQAAFLAELLAAAGRLPAGRAGGVIWNGPERIVSKGLFSARENLALFDAEGKALPAWTAWRAGMPAP